MSATRIRFRYWQGVRYVAAHRPAPATFMRCGTCHRAWDDSKPTTWTPTPSARCPFEYWHKRPQKQRGAYHVDQSAPLHVNRPDGSFLCECDTAADAAFVVSICNKVKL